MDEKIKLMNIILQQIQNGSTNINCLGCSSLTTIIKLIVVNLECFTKLYSMCNIDPDIVMPYINTLLEKINLLDKKIIKIKEYCTDPNFKLNKAIIYIYDKLISIIGNIILILCNFYVQFMQYLWIRQSKKISLNQIDICTKKYLLQKNILELRTIVTKYNIDIINDVLIISFLDTLYNLVPIYSNVIFSNLLDLMNYQISLLLEIILLEPDSKIKNINLIKKTSKKLIYAIQSLITFVNQLKILTDNYLF